MSTKSTDYHAYGCWFPFRMCNGHGADAGKWTVGFQEKAGADIVLAKRPSGAKVVFTNANRAATHADQLNASGVKP